MALSKNITLSSGVSAGYWRILRVIVEQSDNPVLVDLEGYASQGARDAGATPVERRRVEIGTVDNFDSTSTNVLSRAYALLKTLSAYSGAGDA